MRSWAAEDELRSLAAPAKNFASHVKAASPTMLPNPPPTHKHCPSGGFFYFAVSPNTGEHETKRFNPESWPEAAHDLLQFWDRCVQGPSLGFHPATAAAAAAKFACFPIFSSFLGLLACLACHLQIRRIFGAVFFFFFLPTNFGKSFAVQRARLIASQTLGGVIMVVRSMVVP